MNFIIVPSLATLLRYIKLHLEKIDRQERWLVLEKWHIKNILTFLMTAC
jgi:hypothetical protein